MPMRQRWVDRSPLSYCVVIAIRLLDGPGTSLWLPRVIAECLPVFYARTDSFLVNSAFIVLRPFPHYLRIKNLGCALTHFATKRHAQELGIRYVSGLRNQERSLLRQLPQALPLSELTLANLALTEPGLLRLCLRCVSGPLGLLSRFLLKIFPLDNQ
jgi:hypothetical protein